MGLYLPAETLDSIDSPTTDLKSSQRLSKPYPQGRASNRTAKGTHFLVLTPGLQSWIPQPASKILPSAAFLSLMEHPDCRPMGFSSMAMSCGTVAGWNFAGWILTGPESFRKRAGFQLLECSASRKTPQEHFGLRLKAPAFWSGPPERRSLRGRNYQYHRQTSVELPFSIAMDGFCFRRRMGC